MVSSYYKVLNSVKLVKNGHKNSGIIQIFLIISLIMHWFKNW